MTKCSRAAPDVDRERAEQLCQIAIAWFRGNGRDFPWRCTRDVYQILVAEICLQKTNADKVLVVFDKIVGKYPNVEAIANAELSDINQYFSGLGLFKRGSFLIEIARAIVNDYGGVIPRDREALLKIRGIGDYTANSILCLGYGEQLPLLDGSTQRLLSRVFNRKAEKPAWANRNMRDFMGTILPGNNARDFNLALIDIAAAYCRPKKAKCSNCPLSAICLTSNPVGDVPAY